MAEHQEGDEKDPGSQWWFDQPSEDWIEQEHEDGIALSPFEGFIARVEDPFWQVWLAFSSKELVRLRFQRWRFRQERLLRHFEPTIFGASPPWFRRAAKPS